jgi:hypothetical protein
VRLHVGRDLFESLGDVLALVEVRKQLVPLLVVGVCSLEVVKEAGRRGRWRQRWTACGRSRG